MSDTERVGPPRNSEHPNCPDCGSWMQWNDEHAEIEMALETGELDPEKAPAGPWGYWACSNCGGENA